VTSQTFDYRVVGTDGHKQGETAPGLFGGGVLLNTYMSQCAQHVMVYFLQINYLHFLYFFSQGACQVYVVTGTLNSNVAAAA